MDQVASPWHSEARLREGKTITPTDPQHHLALPTGDQSTKCRSHVEVDALTVQPDPTTGFAFEIWMHIKS